MRLTSRACVNTIMTCHGHTALSKAGMLPAALAPNQCASFKDAHRSDHHQSTRAKSTFRVHFYSNLLEGGTSGLSSEGLIAIGFVVVHL